jgi:vitamin B12 transporter
MKKNYAFVAAGLGLAQLVLLSTAAHAQDTSRVLNNVVVTASRSPKKLSDIGRVVTVISAADIAHAQGKSLPELLNTVPGITFSGANNAPGISSSVYLRGASSGNTLILVDGFPVNNADGIDGTYDLNAFPLDIIDHIEILKGTGSTLYGSDAVAGVINIITKHGKENGLKNTLQLAGGSYNTFNEAYGLNGMINKTGIAVNLSNSDNRGFPAATDTTGKGGYRNDDFHQLSASVNLNQQISERFTLNGNFQGTYNSGHLPYGAFTDDKNDAYNNTFILGGIGGKLLLPKGALIVNLSQNSVHNNYTDQAGSTNYNTYSFQKNKGNITNAEAVFNYSLYKYLDISRGLDYKYRSTNQVGSYDTITSATAHNSIASVYTSLFLKAGIFHMELGGRYNHDSKYGSNFTYTINPSILLADQFKLFGTMASAYKSPSLYQLFSIYGNALLKPETTTSYEAGFDWDIIANTLSWNTVFYKNNTNDVIYFAGLNSAPYGVYRNGELQKAKGFESELKYSEGQLTATAFAAYLIGSLTDENGVTTNVLIRKPKNTFGANVYYQFFKNFSAGAVYKYTGDRSDDKFNNVTYTTSVVALKHYNLVDAHLQFEPCKKISLFADLRNLFNAKYTDWVGYNTQGFNFIAGLKYRIN